MKLRPYQEDILVALREQFKQGKRSVVLYAPTGAGKCLGIDTPVLLSDGRIVKVQDVKCGDKLMGPDGLPRTVLSTTSGVGNLYLVNQVKGDSYVVNSDHILSLKTTSLSHGLILADGTHIHPGQDMVNVNVEVFCNSTTTARHCLKGWKPNELEFDLAQAHLLLDPYWLGLWLGDGRSSDVSLCKPECEATRWWVDHATSLGHEVSRYQYKKDDCPEWRIKKRNGNNYFLAGLRHYNLINNKHVPDHYKFSSIENRKKLLAGLMDSDGSVDGPRFDWISASESLAHDVAFICRSVGLRVKITHEKKSIKSYGFSRFYWRLSITGNCCDLPTKDKKPAKSRDKRRSNITGISVSPIGVGKYFGFEITGDKLFLLGDFTVTHNTEISIALLEAARQKKNRSAMILDRIVLVNQTSERLDKYDIDHGVLQSGHWRWRPYEYIQVCSAQTLERRGRMEDVSLLIIDECHATRRQTVEFIRANPQVRVIGLSATPFTRGMGKVYDGIVSTITTKQLVDQGVLVPLKVFISKEIDMTGAKKVGGEWTSAEASDRGMKIVGDVVTEWIKKTHEIFGGPKKTVVFAAGVSHGIELSRKFQEQGYNFVCVSYRDEEDFKRQIIEDFAKPDTHIHGLIATDILTKGFDCPDVRLAVSARPFSKSLSSHIQQMGRVMRGAPGKDFGVWLCLAKGSLILTDLGLVPIEKVTTSHKIWDGANFVEHKGAVCNGIQKVITYQGLTATSGHLVHTSEGWRTFGYCAAKQIRITQTGFGRIAVRIGEDNRSASFLVGRSASNAYSCVMRVCNVWLQKCHKFTKLKNGEVKRMQVLQSASASISDVAIQPGSVDESKMRSKKPSELSNIWRKRDKIQIFWSKTCNYLDYGKSWVARIQNSIRAFSHSIGSDRPKWTLRARKFEMAFSGIKSTKQKRKSIGCQDAQIQNRTPGDSLFGQHIKAFLLGWNDGRSNRRKIQEAISETKREVWDILDAGPHNCFTCEGLLVHNCFSGNYLRFRSDWENVYEQGVHTLNDDKERPKKEPTPTEKEDAKCPSCQSLWERGWKSCGHCGFTRERPNMVESVPGEMEELGVASREDKQAFWSMLRYKVVIEGWSSGRAAHTYKEKFGVWPRKLDDDKYLVPDEACEKFCKELLKRYLRKVHAIKGKR